MVILVHTKVYPGLFRLDNVVRSVWEKLLILFKFFVLVHELILVGEKMIHFNVMR